MGLSCFGRVHKMAEHFTHFAKKTQKELLLINIARATRIQLDRRLFWRISAKLNIFSELSEKQANEQGNLTSIHIRMF